MAEILQLVSRHRIEAVATSSGWTVPQTIEKSEAVAEILGTDALNGFTFIEAYTQPSTLTEQPTTDPTK